MALSVDGECSSNSRNSNSTSTWKFHVFLSFTGKDTRRNFTDHLYAALWRRGIITFRDDDGLERGEVISQQLLKAIEGSLFAVVVLSQNYASSTWCLDELKKILEAKNELGREVFPIFYGVDPSDVRQQRGSFAESLAKHEERFKENKENVQRWRDALTQVANLSGWDSKGWHETNLIENIVGVIWTKLWSKLPPYNDNLVGIDTRIVEMNSLLEIGLDDVRFVGIWGMGGIGKTTLARFVYERISSQFDISCFLANVREVSERDGQVHLQREILSHLKIRIMGIKDTYEGRKLIKNLFYTKKTLLVLDDINDKSQLENLIGSPEWFGTGSRVIITTRDVHLLKSHGVHGIYKTETMKEHESLQLLSKKAFKKDHPEEGYLDLSKSVVQYARGLPLALEVLGCFLCGRSIPEWEEALDKLKQIPDYSILHTLKISYDGLDHEEKAMFLDIACFFKGWRKDEVIQILKNCSFHAIIGLNRLIEKCLLVDMDDCGKKCIEMHDLLQDLGKSIVFEESPISACRRSRLWTLEDIDEVLKNNTGTEATQGMVLHLHEPHEVYWVAEAFSKMHNLRLLIVSSELNLPRGLKCLSSALKVLQWSKYPLKALPPEIPNKLVDIKLQYSKIKQLWYGIQCLGKLKFIDLSHSQYLTKTPSFVGIPNVERLILEGCTSLVEVHPSIGELKMLVEVNLKDCKSLKILPRRLEMNSLTVLNLCGCSKVKKFPELGESMKNLLLLDLQDTAIAELPESLGFLTGLEHLNLKGCKNLVSLPCTFHNLKYLRTLNLTDCTNFSKLPENLNENESLQNLDVSETSIKEAPSSIIQLRNLQTLSFYGCKGSTCNPWSLLHISWKMFGFGRHPAPIGLVLPPLSSLTSLTQLNLGYCGLADGSILNDIGCLSLLRKLELRGNNFVTLPTGCISNLLRLQFLDLGCCPRLKSLPNLPSGLVRLNAGNCASMEPMSDEQLWYHFSSLDPQGGRSDDLLFASEGSDAFQAIYPFFARRLNYSDFIACIPGSEIPSWFPNKNECPPAEEGSKISQVSMTVDIPQCCLESEWSRIALCVVLDLFDHSTVDDPIEMEYSIWQDSNENMTLIQLRGNAIIAEGAYPHLCLMSLDYRDTKPRSGRSNQLQIRVSMTTTEAMYFPDYLRRRAEIKEIGWRWLCKEDLEEWYKGNEFNQSSLAEVDTGEEALLPCSTHRKRKRQE